MKKRITVVLPCYNEEGNIQEMYSALNAETSKLTAYDFDYLFIDNNSTDRTRELLRDLGKKDPRVKAIFNTRNFGHIRSPYHALMQTDSDAVISMASDLQDPPALIGEFIKKWEDGAKVVSAVKTKSDENIIMSSIRKCYYWLLDSFSDIPQIRNFTGFGLYDGIVIKEIKKLNEPYPYMRGIIAELGYRRETVEFRQPLRKFGITKNNFFTLYDLGILGLISYSKAPLRIATFTGLCTAILCIAVAAGYLIYKLAFWDQFQVGLAPIVIGLFFISSVQLFFLGVIGEYIGVIFTQTKNRPHAIEQERINF